MRFYLTYIRKFILLAGFLVSGTISFAQVFPVDLNLNILRPHAPAFHTLGNPSGFGQQANQIQLFLTLKDSREPMLNIGLQWEIVTEKGRYNSNPELSLLPINLIFGMPTSLNNSQLSAYFSEASFPQGMLNNGFLPQGACEICATAIELTNRSPVSLKVCAFLFLEELDPPVILLPLDSIIPYFPQNVQLSWQPLHAASFPVEYTLEIWEMIPGLTPEQIVTSTPPFFVKDIQQMTTTFLGPSDPPLIVGSRYLAQVTARDIVNMGGLPPVFLFKNLGRSPVHIFKYGYTLDDIPCEQPTGLGYDTSEDLDTYIYWDGGNIPAQGQGIVMGNSNPEGNSSSFRSFYNLNWREKNESDPSGTWSNHTTDLAYYNFDEFKRGRTYQVFVEKACPASMISSDTIEISFSQFPPERPYECGQQPLELMMENQSPLQTLLINDTIMAGDTRVIITEVIGGNGNFSGEGFFKAPFIKSIKLAVEFNNILINDEYRLVQGDIITKWDPTGSNIIDGDGLEDLLSQDEYDVPEVFITDVDSIGIDENGNVIVYHGGGSTTFSQPIIVNSNSGSYAVSGGYVMPILEDFVIPDDLMPGVRLKFTAHENSTFGFDPYDDRIPDQYQSQEDYKIPYKSIGRGLADSLVGTLEGAWDINKIMLVSSRGAVLPIEVTGSNSLLIRTAGVDDNDIIYAIAEGGSGLGLFFQKSYQYTNYHVHLVKVNGAGNNIDPAVLENSMNKIMHQGVTLSTVNFHPIQITDTDPDDIIGAQSKLITAYSSDMNRIIRSFVNQAGSGLEENHFYIFLVDNLQGDVAGFMPQGMQFAFIDVAKVSGNSLSKVLTHELGHGAFTLRHYWDDYVGGPNVDHGNLMDYGLDGTRLLVRQWERMHQQRFPLPWLDGDGDGQNVSSIKPPAVFKNQDDISISFMSATGNIISLPYDNLTRVNFNYDAITAPNNPGESLFAPNISTGILYGFKLQVNETTEKIYTWNPNSKSYLDENFEDYIDIYELNVVDGFTYLLTCEDQFILYKLSKALLTKHQNGQGSNYEQNFNGLINTFLPFSSEHPIVNNIYHTLAGFPLNVEFPIQVSSTYCATEPAIIVDKIVQLAKIFPIYIRQFTRLSSWEIPEDSIRVDETQEHKPTNVTIPRNYWIWGAYLDSNPEVEALFETDKISFFKRFIEEFLLFVEQKGDFWEKLHAGTPEQEVVQHLLNEPTIITRNVDYSKRILALSILLNGTIGDHKERAIIKLLVATNKDESADILAYLESTPGGIKYIWDEFQDVFGEHNLSAVIAVISSLIANTNESLESGILLNYLDNPSLLLVLEGDVFRFSNLRSSFLSNNQLQFNSDPTPYSYKRIIPVKIDGTFSPEPGIVLQKGTVVHIPAIQARLYGHINGVNIAETCGWIALDAALMCVGIGELKVLLSVGNYLKKTIVVSDVIGSSIGLAVQMIPEDLISDSLRMRIQLASLAMSLPLLSTTIPKINKVVSEMDNLIKTKSLKPENQILFHKSADELLKKVIQKENVFHPQYSDEILAISEAGCDIACKLKTYGCFTAETPIAVDEGTKPISQISENDYIWSYDHSKQKAELKPVTSIRNYLVNAILAFVLCSGDTIWTTIDHPFYSKEKYIPALNLEVGDTLYSKEAECFVIEDKILKDSTVRVYNLTVADHHNYYVGHDEILVHNENCLAARLPSYPLLTQRLDALPTELKGKLMQDIMNASEDLLVALNKDKGVEAWKRYVAGDFDNSIKLNPEWITKLSEDLSHPTWGNDIANLFDENPLDVKDIWKKLKDDPAYHWELYDSDGFEAGSRWDKWSKREFFKSVTKKGKDFELDLLNKMKTRSGVAYNSLKDRVPDLDDRYLVSQMQFCLPGLSPPCINKGEYFVADQVWIKYDEEGDIVDMVIVDSKLSLGTNFTPGQAAAKNYVNGNLNYKSNNTIAVDDLGEILPLNGITQGTGLKLKSFYKGYGDGNKTFIDFE
jgi:hypothetical protein